MPRVAPSLALLVVLAACAPPQEPTESTPPPAVVMHGVKLRSFEGGTVSLLGVAQRATYERTGEITATQATLDLPGRSPGERTVVRARTLEGNLGTRQLVASGGVEVRTASGMVAHTPRALYDAAQQTARGHEGVELQGPDYRLRADAFSLALPEGRFTFEGSVQTVLEPAP